MPLFDEESRPKPVAHAIGEDLAKLSEDEIRERIAVLQAEIDRLDTALQSKQESRRAASSFFKS